MGKLEGKVAVVTGSGRNIGRATVLKLAAEGAHVVVNARSNHAEADAVVREAEALGVKALAVIADIAKTDEVEMLAERTLSDIWPRRHPDQQCRHPAAQAVHRADDAGLGNGQGGGPRWSAVSHARAHRIDGGKSLSDASCSSPAKGRSSAAADAPISRPPRWVWSGSREDWPRNSRQHNIRVNVVSPGIIDTRRDNPEWYQGRVQSAVGIPLGRQGKVDEIAATCLFLVSDDSGFITGQTIPRQWRKCLLLILIP